MCSVWQQGRAPGQRLTPGRSPRADSTLEVVRTHQLPDGCRDLRRADETMMRAQRAVDLLGTKRTFHLQVALTLSYTHDCCSMIIWVLAAQRVVATSPLPTA